MAKTKTIKVLATVNILGLSPGEQVEIDRWPIVDTYLAKGLLMELQPVKGKRTRS